MAARRVDSLSSVLNVSLAIFTIPRISCDVNIDKKTNDSHVLPRVELLKLIRGLFAKFVTFIVDG